MNYSIIRYFMGKIMLVLAVLLLIPFAMSLFFRENNVLAYVIPIAALVLAGSVCAFKKPKSKDVHTREGLLICAVTWVLMSFFGALPFCLSGDIPSFTDAYFETVSGFTTTGSTILSNIEGVSKSLLFWRSFTHWIGGMGVLVFALAIFSQKDTRTMYIMRAEVPGPKVGKLVSRTRFTARILYIIYLSLTLIEVLFLLAGDMPLFDSITTAMSTAGTGGFSPKNASIAAYNSPYIEYVVAVFMLLFGVNFTLYYFLLMKNFKDVVKNEELRWYLIIVGVATLLICGNIYPIYKSFEPAFRNAFFQVSSIITTTGFATGDYNVWPAFSQAIVFLLMFIGGCAGSTGGGLKVVRSVILCKIARKQVKNAINPRAVISVKLDSHSVDESMEKGICAYFTVYMVLMLLSIAVVCLDTNLNITEAATSVITCVNNVGPGLGLVGPTGNFSELSDFSKWVLIFDMLAGRLELYPILVLFSRSFWK